MRITIGLLFILFALICNAQTSLDFAVPGLFFNPDNFEVSVDTSDLAIPTFDSNVNTTHPDVIFRSAGWNGYKYWMAHTPYPFEIRENPSIEVSNDGITWIDPPGLTNPLQSSSSSSVYYSDVELIDRIDAEGRLYLVYRWEDGTTNKLYYTYSTDGITWAPQVAFMTTVEATLLAASPTIVYKDGFWKMWYVDVVGGANALYDIYYRQATTLLGLGSAQDYRCHLTYPSGKHHWHFKITWDAALNNYVMLMCYTDATGGNPNNLGILNFATSMDGINWTQRKNPIGVNKTSTYRSIFVRTDNATARGAAYELYWTYQWRMRHGFVFIKPDIRPSFAYDGVNGLEGVYALRTRLGHWYKMPLGRVQRSSDSKQLEFYSSYPSSTGELVLADSTNLNTWKGAGTLSLVRLYNQIGKGDYIFWNNFPTLSKVSGIWDGTPWAITFNGTNTVGETFLSHSKGGGQNVQGLTTPVSIQSGYLFSEKRSGNFFGNPTPITLLSTSSITALHIDFPQVYSGIYGASSAYIKRNGALIAQGTTALLSTNNEFSWGARYTGGSYSGTYMSGTSPELVLWNRSPIPSDLTTVENRMMVDYPHTPAIAVNDTFTDSNGTLLTSHTPDTRPGTNIWSTSDANWNIQSNKLTRSASGSGIPVAYIDCGQTDGNVEVDITTTGSAGSGLVYRYIDGNNFCYIRLFNNTTLGVIRYVGGVLQTPSSVVISAPGSSFHIKVQKVGNNIQFFINGGTTVNGIVTPQLSYTETNFPSATLVGLVTVTGEQATTYDNFKFSKF